MRTGCDVNQSPQIWIKDIYTGISVTRLHKIGQEDQNDICMLATQMLRKSVVPVAKEDDCQKTFQNPFDITTDNYFANEQVLN